MAEREELERLRKLKRLAELEAKAAAVPVEDAGDNVNEVGGRQAALDARMERQRSQSTTRKASKKAPSSVTGLMGLINATSAGNFDGMPASGQLRNVSPMEGRVKPLLWAWDKVSNPFMPEKQRKLEEIEDSWTDARLAAKDADPAAYIAGEVAGSIAPGAAIHSAGKKVAGPALKELAKLSPKGGDLVSRGLRYGSRLLGLGAESAGLNAVYQGTVGASNEELADGEKRDFGKTLERGIDGATDPIAWAAGPVLSGLGRGANLFRKGYVTPDDVAARGANNTGTAGTRGKAAEAITAAARDMEGMVQPTDVRGIKGIENALRDALKGTEVKGVKRSSADINARIADGFKSISEKAAALDDPTMNMARLIESEFSDEAPHVAQTLRQFLLKVGMDSPRGASVVQGATDQIRGKQNEVLTAEAKAQLGDTPRIDMADELDSTMKAIGDEGYVPALKSVAPDNPVGATGWEGPVPKEPQGLLGFIRQQGGLKESFGQDGRGYMRGTVEGILGDVRARPGLLNNKTGKTLDQLRRDAQDAGFEIADDDDFIRALGDELQTGNKTFRIGEADEWEAYMDAVRMADDAAEGVSRGQQLAMDRISKTPEADTLLFNRANAENLTVEQYIQRNPLEALHWLRSDIDRQARSLAGKGTPDVALERRVEAMDNILREHVPNYRKLSQDFASASKAKENLGYVRGTETPNPGDQLKEVAGFGTRLFGRGGSGGAARTEMGTETAARVGEAMDPLNRKAAALSVRDTLLDDLRKARTAGIDDRYEIAGKFKALEREGGIDALIRVFGKEGEALANRVRQFISANKFSQDIDPMFNSRTMNKAAAMKDGAVPFAGRIGRAMGAGNGGTSASLAGDAALVASGQGPLLTLMNMARRSGEAFQPSQGTQLKIARTLLKQVPENKPAPQIPGGSGSLPPAAPIPAVNRPPTPATGPLAKPAEVPVARPAPDPQGMSMDDIPFGFSGVRTDAGNAAIGGAVGGMHPDLDGDRKVTALERLLGIAGGAAGALAVGPGVRGLKSIPRSYAKQLDQAGDVESIVNVLGTTHGKPKTNFTRAATAEEVEDASLQAIDDIADALRSKGLAPDGATGRHQAQMHVMDGTRGPDDVPMRAFRQVARDRLAARGLEAPEELLRGESALTNRGEEMLRGRLTDALDGVRGKRPVTSAAEELPRRGDQTQQGVSRNFDLEGWEPPTSGMGFSGGRPRRVKPDIPLGTPSQAGPSRTKGVIERALGQSSGVGAAKAVGNPELVRKEAFKRAEKLVTEGKTRPAKIHQETGYVPIEYQGQQILIYSPTLTPDEVMIAFYSAVSNPAGATPAQRTLLESVGLLPKPLQLGTSKTPIVARRSAEDIAKAGGN